jgi:uncharacterized protein YecE (DUF72 family)
VIRVGTAGWSYPDWDGRVYPKARPHGFHPLALLARTFDCVEINSTFYGVPSERNSERWAHLVDGHPAFRFLVKLNREFTHVADDGAWEPKARAFLAGIEPLRRARRLAALLVQFPISFLYGKQEVRRLGSLRLLFGALPLALEVRHQSWFTPPAVDVVRGLSFSLVHLDMPPAWNHPPADPPSAGPIGYLRLHGRNSQAWFRSEAGRDERYDYLYTPEEIGRLAVRARRLSSEHDEVYVVTNNHFAGKAFANGVELLHELRGERVPVPAELVRSFPRLEPLTRIEGQQQLFEEREPDA